MTVDLTKPAPAGAGPGPGAAVLRRRSRAAVGRSAAADRTLLVVLGLLLLAAGVLVALLAFGVVGAGRAGRPLLDPVVVDALRAQPLLARGIALAAGIVLLVLGLVWTARSLRPERRPDLVLDRGPATAVTVRAPAAAEALAAQATALPGVARARARLVGTDTAPAARLTLRIADDADVGDVLERLTTQVLGPARSSLGLAALPVAVRLELEQPVAGPRVT